jgi:hypothetical protein
MIYQVTDLGTLDARDDADLVMQLHKCSHAPAVDDAAWMVQAADRASDQTGAAVRSDTAANFVEDLIACGLIRREP